MPSNLEPPAGVGWHGDTLELFHQGVPERSCPSRGRGSRATSPTTQGQGRLEEYEAARSLHVLENGLSLVELLNLAPLISHQSFVYLSHEMCVCVYVFFLGLCVGHPRGFHHRGVGERRLQRGEARG